LTDLQGKVGSLEADMARLAMAKEEVRLQVDQVDRKYTEEASSKLAESRLKLAEAREKLRVAQDVLARTEIRAPRAGRVVGSNVHTIGAVIKPGETVMEIVPNDDDLVVAAKVSPIDVTHVHAGMAAEVRLPAFKSRTTPVTMGEVASVGADALLNDVTHQTSYELRVSIRAADLPPQIRQGLRPGMPAQVFISTGERTVIAYLTQPLFDTLRSGLREE
jgi:HlyD family type I secretion membrane fusion protein